MLCEVRMFFVLFAWSSSISSPLDHSRSAMSRLKPAAVVALGFAVLLCETEPASSSSVPGGGGGGGQRPQQQQMAVSTWWVDHSATAISDLEGGNGGEDSEDTDVDEESSSSDFEDTWKQQRNSFAVPLREQTGEDGEEESSSSDDEEEGSLFQSSTEQQREQPPIGSQPLQTLEKLQQMLDETDYRTTSSSAAAASAASSSKDETRLWTSKDRSKYKKQQMKQKEAMEQEQQHRQQNLVQGERRQQLPVRPPSLNTGSREQAAAAAAATSQNNLSNTAYSATGTSTTPAMNQQPYHQNRHQQQHQQRFYSRPASDEEEDSDDTDDGLGYVLPDLPIYNSDDEGETSGDEKRSLPIHQQRQQHQWTSAQVPRHMVHEAQDMSSRQPPSSTNPNNNNNYPPIYPLPPAAYGPHPALTQEQLANLRHQQQQLQLKQQRSQSYTPQGPHPAQYTPPQQQQQQQQSQQHPYPPQQYYSQSPPPYPIANPQNVYPSQPQQVQQSAVYHYPPYYYASNPQQQQQAPQTHRNPYAVAPGWGHITGASPSGYARQPELEEPPYHTQPQQRLPAGTNYRIPGATPSAAAEASRSYEPSRLRNIRGQHPAITVPRIATSSGAPQHSEAISSPGEMIGMMTKNLPEYATTFPIPASSNAAAGSGETADKLLKFQSIRKISCMLVTVALFAYAAVSPRTLPLTEYNLQFYENLRIVYLSIIAPAFYMICVCDGRENDINAVVSTFFHSFMVGYAATLLVEIVATTLVRLLTFYCFEPEVYSLTPKIPIPILPWVLRENNYRPKRITLFSADFGASCVAAPIIEESVKLLLLQRTAALPRNFNWVTKLSTSKRNKKKKKRRVPEAIFRNIGEKDCVNANRYVTHMLAASLGLKLADAGRRIFLYTKPSDENKGFYAVCRGVFPIQELCGTMTALALAKRDLLGVDMPLWKVLAPAVVIHGMANFRGMKPIFKWNSATPWSEMQLFPWNFFDVSTFPELVKKVYGKIMWAIILSRVLGYCVKNYYMVNRQAVKRTTTYAGKSHAAFSAELATAEMLIKSKKQK